MDNNFLGVPLTLEELRGMDGQPVKISVLNSGFTACRIVVDAKDEYIITAGVGGMCLTANGYGKTWLAYPYHPAHIDPETWTGCEYCTGCVDDRSFLDSVDLYITGDGWLNSSCKDHDICKIEFCAKKSAPTTKAGTRRSAYRVWQRIPPPQLPTFSPVQRQRRPVANAWTKPESGRMKPARSGSTEPKKRRGSLTGCLQKKKKRCLTRLGQ